MFLMFPRKPRMTFNSGEYTQKGVHKCRLITIDRPNCLSSNPTQVRCIRYNIMW